MSFDDKFVLGHVGRFTYQKNHIFLIDIFAALAQKIDNATLLLIGDAVEDTSFLDEAKRKVKDYKLEERVIFAGLRTDIADLMQAMDCFLLPSHFEGLPVVGIEAQAAGLPCCFSDTVTREVQLTKELVQFVSLDSVDYWIKAIEAARQIERRDTLDEMKAAGYDIKNEIEKLQRFYLSKRQVFK